MVGDWWLLVITGPAATQLFFLPNLQEAPFQKKTEYTDLIALNSMDFKWN